MSNFKHNAKKLFLCSAAALTLAASTGCARIETGSVGILKHWGGEISTEPAEGFNWTVWDSMLHEVDYTETRIPITGMKPADLKGVLLDSVEFVASYTIAKEKIPAFYIQTKEVNVYKDESGQLVTTVGLSVVKNMLQHAVQEATKKSEIKTLASNLKDYENDIMQIAQAELEKGYPGVFHLLRVNINHFVQPTSIADQANKMATLSAEKARLEAETKLMESRSTLATGLAVIDAKALAAAVKQSGLTPEQLIAWKNANAYTLQAAALATSPAVNKTVDVAKPPKP